MGSLNSASSARACRTGRAIIKGLAACLAVSLALTLVCGRAAANDTSARLSVTATVVAACGVSSTDLLAQVTSTPSVTLSCADRLPTRVEHSPVRHATTSTYVGDVAVITILF